MISQRNDRTHSGDYCRSRSAWLVLAAFVLEACCLPAALFAQEDVAGARDHPLFPRMPDYFIARYEERPSASYEFMTDVDQSSRTQGFYLRIEYALKQGGVKPDPAEIGSKYSHILIRNGGALVYESKNAIEPRWIARMPTGAGHQVWMEVTVRSEGSNYTLTLVDGIVFEQKVSLSSVGELSEELRVKGSARLIRIRFEPGSNALKSNSEAPLVIVAELMKNEPALRLKVHVEPVSPSGKNGNKLARKRQERIVNFLTSQGIPFSRVRSGDLSESPPLLPGSSSSPDNPAVVFVKF
ncbi:MAG TPA: hypothetical protein VGK99_05780 [Acidobacteriota bacterium]|jgi:hypothetical protein